MNSKTKKGARGRKLGITRKLRGRRVQCTVTASNATGETRVASRPYRVLAKATIADVVHRENQAAGASMYYIQA